MERVGERIYRCTTCGAEIEVQSDDRPVVVIAAHSGKPPERVITVGDVEVHRCDIVAAATDLRVG